MTGHSAKLSSRWFEVDAKITENAITMLFEYNYKGCEKSTS